jgi:hypothetical protein
LRLLELGDHPQPIADRPQHAGCVNQHRKHNGMCPSTSPQTQVDCGSNTLDGEEFPAAFVIRTTNNNWLRTETARSLEHHLNGILQRPPTPEKTRSKLKGDDYSCEA